MRYVTGSGRSYGCKVVIQRIGCDVWNAALRLFPPDNRPQNPPQVAAPPLLDFPAIKSDTLAADRGLAQSVQFCVLCTVVSGVRRTAVLQEALCFG